MKDLTSGLGCELQDGERFIGLLSTNEIDDAASFLWCDANITEHSARADYLLISHFSPFRRSLRGP
jgi:hypothetical protein